MLSRGLSGGVSRGLSRWQVLAAALAALLAANGLLTLVPWGSLAALYQENSLLEYAQLALALGAALVASWRVATAADDFERRLFAALALLLFAISYREADFRAWIAPGSPLHQLSYLLKYAIFPALYGYLLFLLAHCLRRNPPRLLRFVLADSGLLLPLATGLVLCAAALDKGFLDAPGANRLVEEVLELDAYALLLLLVALGERAQTAGPGRGRGRGVATALPPGPP